MRIQATTAMEYDMNTIKETMQDLMDIIKRSKNFDMEQEYQCSVKLLNLGNQQQDRYAQAFAHAYLADYYILTRQQDICLQHLHEAISCSQEHHYDELLLMCYTIAGLYYNSHFDEISAVQYYMNAYHIALEQNNLHEQMVILNNLCVLFMQKNDTAEALRYIRNAYEVFLKQQTPLIDHAQLIVILNLVELYIQNDQLNEAVNIFDTYASQLHEEHAEGLRLHVILLCELYLADAFHRGDEIQKIADYFAAANLHHHLNRSMYFSFYNDIFDILLKIKDKKRCEQFLQYMGEICLEDDIEQQLQLHLSWINFAEVFHMEDTLINSYKQYYLLQKMVVDVTNKTKAESMKEKILMEHMLEEQERIVQEKNVLEARVKIDGLTGLFNRSYFNTLCDIMQKNPDVNAIGIILVDVDYFKEFNDLYGHYKGDELLRRVALCLDENGDSRFFAARYGGDEFICLCVNTGKDEIEGYLTKVYEDLKLAHIEHATSPVSSLATISIGYSLFDNDEDFDLETSITMADTALYQAKNSGRNRHSCCS